MQNISRFISRVESPSKFIAAGVALTAMLQTPVMHSVEKPEVIASEDASPAISLKTAHVLASQVNTIHNASLVTEFFGEEISSNDAQDIIERKIEFVRTRPAYPASLAVVQKHQNTIKKEARAKNVPEDVALGVALLENGGSETAESSAGAMGVFQLMPGTARNLGLEVSKNKGVDERKNPNLNIAAGITYLRNNYERFGNWGLSTWAYHAGEGNVSKAVKIYAKANHGVKLKGVSDAGPMREYIAEHDITINKLLSDPEVQKFTDKLSDDSSGYPYKVVATAALFRQAEIQNQLGIR